MGLAYSICGDQDKDSFPYSFNVSWDSAKCAMIKTSMRSRQCLCLLQTERVFSQEKHWLIDDEYLLSYLACV